MGIDPNLVAAAEYIADQARTESGNDLNKVNFNALVEKLKTRMPGFTDEDYSKAVSQGLQNTR